MGRGAAGCMVAMLWTTALWAAWDDQPLSGRANEVHLEHLGGPLYVVVDDFYLPENLIAYVGSKGVTLIGASWAPVSARAIAQRLHEITPLPVTDVIDTSGDMVRVGGNAYWKVFGAHVHATRQTAQLLERHWRERVAAQQALIPTYPALAPTLPTDVHAGDFELEGGRIRVMHLGPARSPDALFVYFPADQVLFGGDSLMAKEADVPNAHRGAYARTLGKLQALHLPIKAIIAGRGVPIHGPELIAEDLQQLAPTHAKHAR